MASKLLRIKLLNPSLVVPKFQRISLDIVNIVSYSDIIAVSLKHQLLKSIVFLLVGDAGEEGSKAWQQNSLH